ncbi:MAG: hypothetical protein U0234_16145 [Sandaracinus sp.]
MTATVATARPGSHEEPRLREVVLALVPMGVAWRVVAGIALGACWTLGVLEPLLVAIESDFPRGVLIAATGLAMATPALLYVRRHALDASVRWNEEHVTLLVAGRVLTALTWKDAVFHERTARGPGRYRALQISDRAGRRITVVTGARLGCPSVEGRRLLDGPSFEALRETARRRSLGETPTYVRERATPSDAWGLVASLGVLAALAWAPRPPSMLTLVVAATTSVLVLHALVRLRRTFARPIGTEMLVIDAEERGRLRARRLDGSRVLLDVAAAAHPDALLTARRGLLAAVVEEPEGKGATYRSVEAPLAATFVETRDDRVLRFERVRGALVDLVGYGTLLATAVAAALVSF